MKEYDKVKQFLIEHNLLEVEEIFIKFRDLYFLNTTRHKLKDINAHALFQMRHFVLLPFYQLQIHDFVRLSLPFLL